VDWKADADYFFIRSETWRRSPALVDFRPRLPGGMAKSSAGCWTRCNSSSLVMTWSNLSRSACNSPIILSRSIRVRGRLAPQDFSERRNPMVVQFLAPR
jgi:hypothetical protein